MQRRFDTHGSGRIRVPPPPRTCVRPARPAIGEFEFRSQPLAETPLPSSRVLGHARCLGSPAVPVWLIAPCCFDGLGGVAAGMVGCVDL
jgi:hypothetical protein